MHFYVDESGHTGPNIFDPEQPMLYYGVLSSPLNIDVIAFDRIKKLRQQVGKPRLHAAELGNGGLASIAADLIKLQKHLNLRFDIYRIAKRDHAIISFFDQVFDQGMNPAVTWSGYWTPLRYLLLQKVACLFDDGLAKLAWEARLEPNDKRCNQLVSEACFQLIERVNMIPDARSQQVIGDALRWAAQQPGELHYNAKTKGDKLAVMPNVIGFQFVMMGIAARLRKTSRQASRVVVDQQSQFNKSQKTLHQQYVAASKVVLEMGPGMPTLDLKGIPDIPIDFSSGTASCGLELVDIYLWIFKRAMEKKEIAPELWGIINSQAHRGQMDEVSLVALERRWSRWFKDLPKPTQEEMERGREFHATQEAKRLAAIQNSSTNK